MAFNNPDREKAVKKMEDSGFSWTSDKSKMTDGKGNDFKVNPSGGSVTLNGDKYTDLSGLNSSRHLKK